MRFAHAPWHRTAQPPTAQFPRQLELSRRLDNKMHEKVGQTMFEFSIFLYFKLVYFLSYTLHFWSKVAYIIGELSVKITA